MEIINSIINGEEVAVEVKTKFLSNEVRAKIIGVDAKYSKLSRKYTSGKNSFEAIAKEIAEVEKLDISEKDKESKISSLLEKGQQVQVETWNMIDAKNQEIMMLITISPNGEYGNAEFWSNADQGKIQEIIANFRTKYRF